MNEVLCLGCPDERGWSFANDEIPEPIGDCCEQSERQLRCVKCGKELDDGGYIALDNWLQWHYYTKIGPSAEANCYCSTQCFADDWMLTWMDADEFDWVKGINQKG